MKVHEFERVVNKLGMETRNSSDRLAWLVHEGVTVVRTRRSHGNNKYMPEHQIRQQLKVNESQFAGLISCSVSKDDYLQILVDKGLIQKAKTEPESEPDAATAKKQHLPNFVLDARLQQSIKSQHEKGTQSL